MLPLVDKPLIQYAVEEAYGAGLTDIIVITGRGKSAIEDHFDVSFELEQRLQAQGRTDLVQDLRRLVDPLKIAYVRQHEPLGLGHAVLQAASLVAGETCAVLLADDVVLAEPSCLTQLLKVHNETGESVVALMEVGSRDVSSYGIVRSEATGESGPLTVHRIREVVEKPPLELAPSKLAVIGRYVLHPDVFGALRDLKPGRNGEIQLSDALQQVAQVRPVFGVQFSGRRFDAGSKIGFIKATIQIALEREDLASELMSYIGEVAGSTLRSATPDVKSRV
jgi:UTP--glucose-1-phosphate uridylyltransferase